MQPLNLLRSPGPSRPAGSAGLAPAAQPALSEAAHKHSLIFSFFFFFVEKRNLSVKRGRSPTCQDGLVGLELLPSDVEAAVGEAGALPQVPQVVRELTLRDLQHVHVGLA